MCQRPKIYSHSAAYVGCCLLGRRAQELTPVEWLAMQGPDGFVEGVERELTDNGMLGIILCVLVAVCMGQAQVRSFVGNKNRRIHYDLARDSP